MKKKKREGEWTAKKWTEEIKKGGNSLPPSPSSSPFSCNSDKTLNQVTTYFGKGRQWLKCCSIRSSPIIERKQFSFLYDNLQCSLTYSLNIYFNIFLLNVHGQHSHHLMLEVETLLCISKCSKADELFSLARLYLALVLRIDEHRCTHAYRSY